VSAVELFDHAPRFAVCITTMHRPDVLERSLESLVECQPPPCLIVVSDDSVDPQQIKKTRTLVERFPGVIYLSGPHRGVCANRNSALEPALGQDIDYVSFMDDDILVPENFFQCATAFYSSLTDNERPRTICTGTRREAGDTFMAPSPVRLNFRGYFESSNNPESVTVSAAVFPIEVFAVERWDDDIFFGSEDAEFSLRALARGFVIRYVHGLTTSHLATDGGILHAEQSNGMTKYELCSESARLYIGIKRYLKIQPNPFKLVAFVTIYFAFLIVRLSRKSLLGSLLPIVRTANLGALLKPNLKHQNALANSRSR